MSLFGGLFGGNKKQPAPAAPMSPEDEFVNGKVINCTSSNVSSAFYEKQYDRLTITFHDNSTWQYTVSEGMARSFFNAGSRGKWVWDHLKVRGTVSLHRVPAVKII